MGGEPAVAGVGLNQFPDLDLLVIALQYKGILMQELLCRSEILGQDDLQCCIIIGKRPADHQQLLVMELLQVDNVFLQQTFRELLGVLGRQYRNKFFQNDNLMCVGSESGDAGDVLFLVGTNQSEEITQSCLLISTSHYAYSSARICAQ